MKQHLAIELIVVLGLSATALVAAQRVGAPLDAAQPFISMQLDPAPRSRSPASVRGARR